MKNICRHLWEKRVLLSPPHVNASSLSPPRSQYQLNCTNGIGGINCLCNWLKYFTIKQQWHLESCVSWSMPPSLLRLLLRRKNRQKDVRSWNKSAHRIIVGYLGALYTATVLGNHPVPLKLQRIFFWESRQGVSQGVSVWSEDQSSRVYSPCSNQVRGTQAGFSFIKASFQESEHNVDSFRFLKKQNVHITSWFRGKVMQWLKCQLLSLLHLDYW